MSGETRDPGARVMRGGDFLLGRKDKKTTGLDGISLSIAAQIAFSREGDPEIVVRLVTRFPSPVLYFGTKVGEPRAVH